MNVLNKLIVATLPAVPKPIVRQFAHRYIAGEEISDAVRVVQHLNSRGLLATLDLLGEDIHDRSEAVRSRDMILEVLETIMKEKLDSNVSIKLTQVGLKLDRMFCLETMRVIVHRAKELNNFIRIDMEDTSCTDDTIWVYRELRKEFPNVGVVLQAYLRRTESDVLQLSREGLGHFRLCKGIYIEPVNHAFKLGNEINRNFLSVLAMMFDAKAYVGIATHDDELVIGASKLIRERNIRSSDYEFQMLYGVRPELHSRITGEGHRLRIYVPFGRQWYQYSIRRFKENPQIAGYVFKALFQRNRLN